MRKLACLLLVLASAPAAQADTLVTGGPRDTFDVNANFVTGLSNLTDLRTLPDGRIVLIQKSGEVFVRPAGGGALVMAGTFAVDQSSEKGLLGVAVTPD